MASARCPPCSRSRSAKVGNEKAENAGVQNSDGQGAENGAPQQDGPRVQRPVRLRSARTLAEAVWFPAALFLGFLFCFAPALHAPQPHHAHVAVADAAVAHQVGTSLERRYPAGFDVSAVPGADQARRAVLDRDAVAGFVGGSRPVLYVAGANGASLEQALTKAFTVVADERGGHPLMVRTWLPPCVRT